MAFAQGSVFSLKYMYEDLKKHIQGMFPQGFPFSACFAAPTAAQVGSWLSHVCARCQLRKAASWE